MTRQRQEGRRAFFDRRAGYGVLALGVMVACGERNGFDTETAPVFDTSSDAGAEATVAASCEGTRCSRDFRKIVDGCDDTHVIEECSADQGCSQGKCVPACSAAADSTMGCEFAALPPPPNQEVIGSCFGAVIANMWGISAHVEASYGSDPIDMTQTARIVRTSESTVTYEPFDGELQPGEIAAIFFAENATKENATPCPKGIVPAIRQEAGQSGTLTSPVFQIKTTAPVSAYSFYPLGPNSGGTGTGTLLVPRGSWKTDYLATTAWKTTHYGVTDYFPTLQIIAAEDETEVTLVGSVPIEGNGAEIPGAGKGTPVTYRLNRAEQLQFQQFADLSGSTVHANKPVGLWTGHAQLRVPEDSTGQADLSATALFPLSAWGNEYALVPYQSRVASGFPEEYLYRITAAVDDTAFTYEPTRPADAPSSLSKGQATMFMTREPFVVKSQDKDHPFVVHAYMTGAMFAQAAGYDGDPEFSTVIPTEQFLGRYVFWVDPGWPSSHLVVIRSRDEGQDFKPVTLDCAGELGDWVPLGTSGKYEYTRPWMKKRGTLQTYGDKTCGGGRRELTSDGPVTVTVWTTDGFASAGYPAGAGLRVVNSVPPPVN